MMLTEQTYHSRDANMAYFSASQFRKMLECPAREIAILRGTFTPKEDSDALLVGSYVDTMLLTPEAAETWKQENKTKAYQDPTAAELKRRGFAFKTVTECLELHPELKGTGEPYACMKMGDMMIARAKRDEVFMTTLAGDHQRIHTFKLFGHPVKVKFDTIDVQSFTDLKTCPALDHDEWDPEARARIIWYDKYYLQIALYWEAFRDINGADPAAAYIAALTKQDPPDIGILTYSTAHRDRFDRELDRVNAHLDEWAAMKAGITPAPKCKQPGCDYCRSTKVLTYDDVVEAQDWTIKNRIRREIM